jgi:hypothetical protein
MAVAVSQDPDRWRIRDFEVAAVVQQAHISTGEARVLLESRLHTQPDPVKRTVETIMDVCFYSYTPPPPPPTALTREQAAKADAHIEYCKREHQARVDEETRLQQMRAQFSTRNHNWGGSSLVHEMRTEANRAQESHRQGTGRGSVTHRFTAEVASQGKQWQAVKLGRGEPTRFANPSYPYPDNTITTASGGGFSWKPHRRRGYGHGHTSDSDDTTCCADENEENQGSHTGRSRATWYPNWCPD